VLATHRKSSPRAFRRSLVRQSNQTNPAATNQERAHGVPVLRRCRRVPPRRLRPVPSRRAGAQAPARPGGGARGGGRRRDKPGHPEGGGQGGRHRPHRRARQAAHRLLPVRSSFRELTGLTQFPFSCTCMSVMLA